MKFRDAGDMITAKNHMIKFKELQGKIEKLQLTIKEPEGAEEFDYERDILGK